MRHALLGAFLVIVCCATLPRRGWTPTVWPERADSAPKVRIILDDKAAEQLEALADSTRVSRREMAACVTIYAYLPTARQARVVAILEVGPAVVPYVSDSLTVAIADSSWRLCRNDEPVIHSHIVKNEVWGRPSPFDSLRAATVAPFAPFHVLVSVDSVRPSKITVYGIR